MSIGRATCGRTAAILGIGLCVGAATVLEATAANAAAGLWLGGFKKKKPTKTGVKAGKVERVEVSLVRADVLDAPRPDAMVIGFVFKGEVMPKLDTSADGNYFRVRHGPFDEGWVDVVAVHETSKPLKMDEAKGRVASGVAGVAAPVAKPVAKPATVETPPAADVDAPAGSAGDSPDGRALDAGGATSTPEVTASDDAVAPRPDAPVDRARLSARVGYAIFAERYASDAAAPYDGYRIRFNQAVAEVAAALWVHEMVGLDARYALGYSAPTDMEWTDGSMLHVGTASHRFDAGASFRLRLSKALGLSAAARLGFMVTRFEMIAANPDALLLTNTYAGGVAGLRLEATRLAGGFGVALSGDALVPLRMVQGPYASGSGHTSWGVRGAVGLSYAFSSRFSVTAEWGATYLHARFWGDGSRTTGTNEWARNDDYLHTFELGARLGF